MTSLSPCCPTTVPPAVNDYKGAGNRVSLEQLGLDYDMYVTGGVCIPDSDSSSNNNNNSSDKKGIAIVVAYDIFGWTANIEQVADRLATEIKKVMKKNVLVVVPDLLRGQPWPVSNCNPITKDGAFPKGVVPGDGVGILKGWIQNHPNTNTNRIVELQTLRNHLSKSYGIEAMGIVGMCWGGKVAMVAAGQRPGLVQAVATCHGSLLRTEDVRAVLDANIPVCMLDSKDEPETHFTVFRPLILQDHQNVYKRFSTVHHGWMGTRGVASVNDFEQSEVQKCWQEAISDLAVFFATAFSQNN